MQHVMLLFLWGWVLNPYNAILLPVAIYEIRVLHYSVDERHTIGFNEHSLEVIGWFATACTAAFVVIMNGENRFWPLTASFAILVLLRGTAMWERWLSGKQTVVYSHVRVVGGVLYGVVLLLAGGITTML